MVTHFQKYRRTIQNHKQISPAQVFIHHKSLTNASECCWFLQTQTSTRNFHDRRKVGSGHDRTAATKRRGDVTLTTLVQVKRKIETM